MPDSQYTDDKKNTALTSDHNNFDINTMLDGVPAADPALDWLPASPVRPLLAMVENKLQPGFGFVEGDPPPPWIWPCPRTRDVGRVQAVYRVLDLGDALAERWHSDAHFVPYVVVGPDGRPLAWQPRIKKNGLAALRAAGLDVRVTVACADVDNAPHEPWTDVTRAASQPVLDKLPGCTWYESRRGLRILQPLAVWVTPEEFEGHVWAAWTAGLAKLGVVADRSCSDWTRHYRLPLVRRDGVDETPVRAVYTGATPYTPPPAPPKASSPPPRARVSQPSPKTPGGNGSSIVARAEKYISAIQTPACRTSSCESVAFKVALHLVKGFMLDEEAAGGLFTAWAARGTHGWTDKQLAKKVADAAGGRAEEGYLLQERAVPDVEHAHRDDGMDVEEFVPASAAPPPPGDPGVLASSVAPGNDKGVAATPGEPQQADTKWEKKLVKTKSGLRANVANVETILRCDPNWQGAFAWDEFNQRVVWTRTPPWVGRYPITATVTTGTPWSDADTTRLRSTLGATKMRGVIGLDVSDEVIRRTVHIVAREQTVHPVRDYLNGLTWDGTPRVANWLTTILGVEASEYSEKAGTWWLVQAVTRIFHPGCVAKYVLVIESEQDDGKSTLLKILGGDWFSDSRLDPNNKESYMQLQGVWVQELAEGEIMGRASAALLKAFISKPSDRYIPKYSNEALDAPRQCVFGLTINEKENYLTDPTGNVRFWPVRGTKVVDLEAVRRDRNQLWAEAVALYRQGVKPYPQTAAEKLMFKEVVDQRRQTDPWEESIESCLSNKAEVTIEEILDMLDIPNKTRERRDQIRVVGILQAHGWELQQHRPTVIDAEGKKHRARVYAPKVPTKPGEPCPVSGPEAAALAELRAHGWTEEIMPDGTRRVRQRVPATGPGGVEVIDIMGMV